MDHPVLLILVKATVFMLMLAMGVNETFQDLVSLWRQPSLLLRSLLAVIVFVPVLVVVLLKLLQLPQGAGNGPGTAGRRPRSAAHCPERSQMAGGHVHYSASLQLSLALLAVFVTPLTLAVLHAFLDLGTKGLSPMEAARQVALVQFLPVSIGLLIRRFGQKIAPAAGRLLMSAGTVLLFLIFILAVVPGFRIAEHAGGSLIAAILIMVAASLAFGHLLGGPQLNVRSALAVASIARNIGLALFIAVLNHLEKSIVPVFLTYMVLGALVGIPYSAWIKRRMLHAK